MLARVRGPVAESTFCSLFPRYRGGGRRGGRRPEKSKEMGVARGHGARQLRQVGKKISGCFLNPRGRPQMSQEPFSTEGKL